MPPSPPSPLPPAAQSVLDAIHARRSVYKLGKQQQRQADAESPSPLSDADLVALVTDIVKQSPSAFNSQTSRVVILLGDDHEWYWTSLVSSSLEAATPADQFQSSTLPRLQGFAAAQGSILVFEDQAGVEELIQGKPNLQDLPHDWSNHSSGMLQINLWQTLTQLGYGANLQHYGAMLKLEDRIRAKWLGKEEGAQQWNIKAELVFGSRQGEPKEKGYTDKHRVLAFGGAGAV